MKFFLLLLLAFSVNLIVASNDENHAQWESICKDFEKDTIAGAGYNNGFCTESEISKKYVLNNRLIKSQDLENINKFKDFQDDLEKNRNNQVVIDLIKAHKIKILSFLCVATLVALVYKLELVRKFIR